jgi:hypothetical protein
MKRLILVPIFLAAVFSGACATTGKYEEKLQSWVGQDINGLIMQWGAPSQTMTLPNGNKLYEFMNDQGGMAYQVPYTRAVSYSQMYCKTTFITNEHNWIINWRWEGNSCRSY